MRAVAAWTGRSPFLARAFELFSGTRRREPPADDEDDDARHERSESEPRQRRIDEAIEAVILQDHLAGDVAEDAAAHPDDPRESVHQGGQDAAAPYDDRQRQRDAE